MSTKEFNYSGFNRINIRFAMEVEITRADAYSVVITGADMLTDNIEVTLEGDKLVIGYKLNFVSFFTAPFTRAMARITLPDLRELNITGAARGAVRGFQSANDFTLQVSGASRLDLAEMSVGNLKMEFSGASRIDGQIKAAGDTDIHVTGATRLELHGEARNLQVEATGASRIDLERFPVHDARYRLTGASRGSINLNGKLDVDLEGASTLEYVGQATMGNVKVTGASTLKKL
jgi:hypothetical protein